jgi:hypothetical protein
MESLLSFLVIFAHQVGGSLIRSAIVISVLAFGPSALAQSAPALTCKGIWAAQYASMFAEITLSSSNSSPVEITVTLENGVQMSGTATYTRGAYAFIIAPASNAFRFDGSMTLRAQDLDAHKHAYNLKLTSTQGPTGSFVCDPQN